MTLRYSTKASQWVEPVLKSFNVQGWKRATGILDTKREPMPMRVIKATDAAMAAKTYASCYQMPRSFWSDGSKSPPVVIRVWVTMQKDGKPSPFYLPIH